MIAEPVIGVLGCGQMGSGIAQVAATAGLQVVIRDTMGGQLEKGRDAIQRSTGKLIEKGKLAAADREAALARISYSTELNDLSRCDLVIEAVTEDLLLKNELWQALDRHCPERTIFADPDTLRAAHLHAPW